MIPATPTPVPSAELVRQATQLIDVWHNLGPLMALLGVVVLALIIVLLNTRDNNKGNATVLSVLADNNIQKDKDIVDLKAQRDQENKQHLERMDALRAQAERANDLAAQGNAILIAINDRGLERDAVQKQMAEDMHTIVNAGSVPVQEILQRVRTFTDVLTRIDTRTADWSAVVTVIQPLMLELGALRAEAKKHSTQPIPAIQPNQTDGANGKDKEG